MYKQHESKDEQVVHARLWHIEARIPGCQGRLVYHWDSRSDTFHLQGENRKSNVESGANLSGKVSKDGQAVHGTLGRAHWHGRLQARADLCSKPREDGQAIHPAELSYFTK